VKWSTRPSRSPCHTPTAAMTLCAMSCLNPDGKRLDGSPPQHREVGRCSKSTHLMGDPHDQSPE
jgi:hypothetical protein